MNLTIKLSLIFLPGVLSFALSLNRITLSYSPTNPDHPSVTSLFQTPTNAQNGGILAESTATTTTTERVSISRPAIHWTVPGYKVGYRDDKGDWYDEDGPRNGPPQNYWRQMSDEREYKRDMDGFNAVLTAFDVENVVKNIEKMNSARYPSLSRKLLGTWAPIMSAGKYVAFDDQPIDDTAEIEVPYTINIFRANGRRLGPKNHYGVFDLKLEQGEELVVKVSSTPASRYNTNADEVNEPLLLGMIEETTPLYLGTITYVTDYIMIQRNAEGAISFWLRADNSYLGVNNA